MSEPAADLPDDEPPDDELELLRRVADTLPGLPYEGWNFGDSGAFEAMLEASRALGDERYAGFAWGFARGWGATRAGRFRRLDCTVPGRALVGLAQAYADQALLDLAVDLAAYLTTRPRLDDAPDGVFETWERSPLREPYGPESLDAQGETLLAAPPPGVFVDCLHFDPPFFTALGSATESAQLWALGVEQANGYIALLQRDSGLFDHFRLRGVERTFGHGWGRGQGWALLGLLDVLRTPVPPGVRDDQVASLQGIRDSAARLAAAMASLQRPDGHWYAVVDDPESGDEYSTAAFMAVGLRAAARLGLGRPVELRSAADAARAATRAGILPDGTLGNVSVAVLACTTQSHYAHVPRGFRVPWGQGPAALALCTSG